MTEYTTRSLTALESVELDRKLTVALGTNHALSALRVIAEMGLGVFVAEEVHGPNYISDEDVNRMHERQSRELLQVPAEDRRVVLSHAQFRVNVSGGNLSGNLWTARRDYERIGAEALAEQTRQDNSALMRSSMRNR